MGVYSFPFNSALIIVWRTFKANETQITQTYILVPCSRSRLPKTEPNKPDKERRRTQPGGLLRMLLLMPTTLIL